MEGTLPLVSPRNYECMYIQWSCSILNNQVASDKVLVYLFLLNGIQNFGMVSPPFERFSVRDSKLFVAHR